MRKRKLMLIAKRCSILERTERRRRKDGRIDRERRRRKRERDQERERERE
jgi:hypothetical protein